MDTNVLSELRKRDRCDPHVRQWYAGISEADIYVPVVVLGEIRRGAELLRRRDPVAAASLDTWLVALRASLGDRLLSVSDEVADRWGQLGIPDALPINPPANPACSEADCGIPYNPTKPHALAKLRHMHQHPPGPKKALAQWHANPESASLLLCYKLYSF